MKLEKISLICEIFNNFENLKCLPNLNNLMKHFNVAYQNEAL
jgi:hypothetical protein